MQLPLWLQNKLSAPQVTAECKDKKLKIKGKIYIYIKYIITAFCKQKNLLSSSIWYRNLIAFLQYYATHRQQRNKGSVVEVLCMKNY